MTEDKAQEELIEEVAEKVHNSRYPNMSWEYVPEMVKKHYRSILEVTIPIIQSMKPEVDKKGLLTDEEIAEIMAKYDPYGTHDLRPLRAIAQAQLEASRSEEERK